MWDQSLSFLTPLVNPLGSSGKIATLNFKIMSVGDRSGAVQGTREHKNLGPNIAVSIWARTSPSSHDIAGSAGHRVLLVPVTIPQADTSGVLVNGLGMEDV